MFFFKEKRKLFLKGLKTNSELLNYNNSCFDFIDLKSLHFKGLLPFQLYGRVNFAYDCFILAMHFILYLTYYYFFLNFGTGFKSRLSLPFYKFFR